MIYGIRAALENTRAALESNLPLYYTGIYLKQKPLF
jgi:hypothetical protein